MKRIFFAMMAIALAAACSKKPIEEPDLTGLRITHTSLEFQFKETSYPVTVMTENPWTISSDAEWLSTSIEGAPQGQSFFVLATANNGEDPRSATLTVSGPRGSKTIKVTQNADKRNFTEISLSSQLKGYQRVEGSFLVIPYREGGKAVIDHLSASVSGAGRGSITVEALDGVTLEEGAGEIRMAVSGRAGASGSVLFTVAGLPPTVYGEAAQCCVEVAAGETLQELSIAQARALPQGPVAAACRIVGTIVSDTGDGVYGSSEAVLQDEGAGITIKSVSFDFGASYGDKCSVFLTGGTLTRENGLLVFRPGYKDDFEKISSGEEVEALALEELPSEDNESMLCSISLTQVAEDNLGKSTFAGTTEMERLGWKSTYRLYVPESASFAKSGLLTGNGTLTGIISRDAEGALTLVPCLWSGVSSLVGERLSLDSTFELDKQLISGISADGANGLSFNLTSSVAWTLRCDADGWVTGWSATSGNASASPQTISFNVLPNSGPRRSAVVTISGSGVPDLTLTLIQTEGARILDCDFSLVKSALQESPKYFPVSAGTDYAKTLSTIGLDGWLSTNCYGALSPDGEYGLLRIGKTLTKGYLQTPALEAIGSTPVAIEANFLAGIYKGCPASWIGVEISGPGTIVADGDVALVNAYDEAHTASLMDTLPMYVVGGLDSKNLKRVSVRIEGATAMTSIRLTATCKCGSSVDTGDVFFIGDFHVEYAD